MVLYKYAIYAWQSAQSLGINLQRSASWMWPTQNTCVPQVGQVKVMDKACTGEFKPQVIALGNDGVATHLDKRWIVCIHA